MNVKLVIAILIMAFKLTATYAQYPFEKHKAIQYKEYSDWRETESEQQNGVYEHVLIVPDFFANGENLKLKLTSYASNWDSSFVSVYRNNKLLQRQFEPMRLLPPNIIEPVRVADINGDGMKDIKMVVPYMGNGLAALNVRVIYLFQKHNHTFNKISFLDKMGENRVERDFNGDGNYEIITMNLNGHKNHNYWTFNLYNYGNGTLKNVNDKYGYPIMVQYLYRDNHKVTDKIDRATMKQFAMELPEEFDKR